MDKKTAVGIGLALVSVMILILLQNLNTKIFLLLSLAFILFSLLFFSRGILIFFATIFLMLGQSNILQIANVSLQLRWVFLILFSFHILGDIFLGRTVRGIKAFDIFAIFFIFFAFFSSFYSPYPKLTLERAVTVLLLYIAVFWIIWKYTFNQQPQKVVRLILQCFGIILTASYISIFIFPGRAFHSGRFQGILQNPNGLAVLCAMLLPLSLWRVLETGKNKTLFILMLISLFLAASRGSIIASVLSLGYLILLSSNKQRSLIFFASLSFFFIFAWAIDTLARPFFLNYIRVETIPTGAGRFEVWPIAIDLILDRPFFGYGFGIEDKLIQLKRIVLLHHPGGYFHNSYLGLVLQLGIMGFVLFFLPLLVLLLKEITLKKDDSIPLLRHALFASFMAGLICAVFESFIYSVGNAQAFPFWIIVMLLTFYRYQGTQKA